MFLIWLGKHNKQPSNKIFSWWCKNETDQSKCCRGAQYKYLMLTLIELYESYSGDRTVACRLWTKKWHMFCLFFGSLRFEYYGDCDNWCHKGKIYSYTGWLIKTSPIFCFRKNTYSKPRQNCYDNCQHFTYFSCQWRHSRHHWEILNFVRLYLGNVLCKTVIRHTARDASFSSTVQSWTWIHSCRWMGIIIL